MKHFVMMFLASSFYINGADYENKICEEKVVAQFKIENFVIEGTVPTDKREKVLSILKDIEACSPKTAYRIYGEINQFGLFGTPNISEALKHYEDSAKLGDLKSHYYLGAIYFTDKEIYDLTKAVNYSEIAAKGGIKEAITNLLHLRKNGLYGKNELLNILEKYASAGDDDIEIFYAQEKYYALISNHDDVGLLNLLSYLLSLKSEKRLKEVYFLIARLYLNEDFSAYSKTEGVKYLELAAQNGHTVAPDLIKFYSENKK